MYINLLAIVLSLYINDTTWEGLFWLPVQPTFSFFPSPFPLLQPSPHPCRTFIIHYYWPYFDLLWISYILTWLWSPILYYHLYKTFCTSLINSKISLSSLEIFTKKFQLSILNITFPLYNFIQTDGHMKM